MSYEDFRQRVPVAGDQTKAALFEVQLGKQ